MMLLKDDSVRDSGGVEATLALIFCRYLMLLMHRLKVEQPPSLFFPILDHSELLAIRIDYKRKAWNAKGRVPKITLMRMKTQTDMKSNRRDGE